MKKKNFLLFSFIILIFSACKSSTVLIPGYVSEQKKSIYVEYFNIAEAYCDLEKYDKAVDYYKKAMLSKNLKWSSYYKLGRCYALSKKWPEAKTVYEKLLERDPSNINIKLSLAYISAMSGNIEEAENYYQKLYADFPDNADIISNYINILLVQRRKYK